jgi:hypothetical protein
MTFPMPTQTFPLPTQSSARIVVPAPGAGPHQWAGAPSAAFDLDGSVVLAYRVRQGSDGDINVIARSSDGEHFVTVAVRTRQSLGAAMVERPALVRLETGWRMYVSAATPGTKRWWIGVIEAPDLEGLATADVRRVFEGDAVTAVKDPVIRFDGRLWRAWVCCHHLEVPGAEDRMSTAFATSDDGLTWDWHGTVLAGRPGHWDARGARLTSVLADGRACYDGRATVAENWFERTGLATPVGAGPDLTAADGPVIDLRYLEVLARADGDYQLYYEARLPDESHELRTERWSPSS